MNLLRSWFCNCPPGFTGSLCERPVCNTNPCRHGGTCLGSSAGPGFLCLCPVGRGGALCQDGELLSHVVIWQLARRLSPLMTLNSTLVHHHNYKAKGVRKCSVILSRSANYKPTNCHLKQWNKRSFIPLLSQTVTKLEFWASRCYGSPMTQKS